MKQYMYHFLNSQCGSVKEPHWSIGWIAENGPIHTLACIAGMTEDQIKVVVNALNKHELDNVTMN